MDNNEVIYLNIINRVRDASPYKIPVFSKTISIEMIQLDRVFIKNFYLLNRLLILGRAVLIFLVDNLVSNACLLFNNIFNFSHDNNLKRNLLII